MNSLIHKTQLDYVQDYLERKESSNLPSWLQYLVLAEEVHQNFEHIDSLQELSTNRVIQYVYRTLVILEEKKGSFLTDEMYWQLAVVLSYGEAAKGGTAEQRKNWLEKGYNLMAHNEGSAHIFWEDYLGYDKPLLFTLIKTHGLIGQYLRGETRLSASRELVETMRSYYDDKTAKELLNILNECIIAAVSNELWLNVKNDVSSTIEKLFQQDFSEDFENRIDRLTVSFSETSSEKKMIMATQMDKVRVFLQNKDLWYVEPSMHDLSFTDFWAILCLAADEITSPHIAHLNFETLMKQLHYDYKGQKHSNVYRKRVIEKFLHEYSNDQPLDTTHVTFKADSYDPFNTVFLSFEFSDVGEALIQFCVEAEKTGGMIHNQATVLLFDLFGLRRDAYDRFNNEGDYLTHMNSSVDDKKVILDFIKGDTILDVGPGGGVLLDLLESETSGKQILGIDISENVIETLEAKKQNENHSWSVIKGNALSLVDSFGPNSIDTIIYSSIIHELYSYIPFEGKCFNQQTIKAALESAFEVLKPGGRMIIRDGIMSDDKKAKRIIRFKTDDGLPFLIQYAKDFKGRKISYEMQSDNEVMMPINDSMEFLYTYTWGTESYAHEVNEQFGYFTPTEYRAFIQDIFGETAEIIKLEHYLQEGYTTHLNEKIDFKTEDGLPAPLPDSTCLLVIEKGEVK